MSPLPLALVASIALLAACPPSEPPVDLEVEVVPLTYPEARRQEVTDTYFDTEVADPYRWLEDPDAEESQAWVAAQNELTQGWLADYPHRQAIHHRLEELWNYEKFSAPSKKADRYFWSRNDGLQNQSVLYWSEGLEGEARLLLDPNKLSEDGTVALAGTSVSEDGKHLAYGLSDGGSDWNTWKVMEIDTGKVLDDELEWIKFSGATWTPDSKGFYYGRYPEPTKALEDVNQFNKLYYHVVGTPQSADELVHENPDQPQWGFSPDVTDDGKWLVLYTSRSTAEENLLWVRPADQPQAQWIELVDEWDGSQYLVVDNTGDTLLVWTTAAAPRGRIIGIDLSNPAKEAWTEVVPEANEVIQGADVVGGKLVVNYLQDAHTVIRLFGTDGEAQGEIDLPGLGSVGGFGGKADDPETFYTYSDFTTPATIYRHDMSTGTSEVFRKPEVDFDPSGYETKQVFVTSKDGTKVPMFIVHKKGLVLDGSSATLLYGYGGFNQSLTPSFGVHNLVWMEMGGVYALANLRGGGEYGEEWHEAGTKLHKQNVFDDFIAAGEWLIDQGYTRTDKLSCRGGSNGGTLVGAVVNQRPDLWGAAIPQVGVMDMLRYHTWTIGWAWAADYGTSEDSKEMFEALYAYSPYHNAKPQEYPAVLVTTADHDDRVVPAHSFKYTAAMQHAQQGNAPILARIDVRAGHGRGKPTAMRIDQYADMWSFLARSLDMDLTGFHKE